MASILFHGALQRVLMPPRRINDLGYFCFRHFVSEHSADPNAVLMDVEHYASRIFARLIEELLKHIDDETRRPRALSLKHSWSPVVSHT